MGKFLTGHVRAEQTEKRGVWRILDNVLYLDDNDVLYLAPRNFQTDFYTIPLLIDFLTGSPSENDTRCSSIHDIFCSTISAVIVTLSIDELLKKGYLRFSTKKNMWVCRNIPKKYLRVEKISKAEANSIFGRTLKAADVPFLKRLLIRLGVVFNIGWYINQWAGCTKAVDLDKLYTKDFWDFVGRGGNFLETIVKCFYKK